MPMDAGSNSINSSSFFLFHHFNTLLLAYLNILLGARPGENAKDNMPKKLSLDYIMKDLFGFE